MPSNIARPNHPAQTAAAVALAERHGAEFMLTAYDQLKPTERIFVDVFVATDSPVKAIVAALPATPANVQNVRAIDFLKRPLVQAAIADKIRRVTEKYDVSVDALVRELAYVAKANMRDYVRLTPEGEPFPDFSEVPYEAWAAVKSIKVEDVKDGRGDDARDIRKVSFELHDKLGAIEKLMKKQGAYPANQLQLTGANGGPIQTQSSVDIRAVTVTMTPEQAAEHYARSLEGE
jgi:phage terminase small subunit